MNENLDPWPDREDKDIKYNADLWEAFCNFESCVRDTNTESFATFFTRWQARLETIEVFGIMYPDQLLVMKLSYACHLDLATVLGLLNVISEQKDGQEKPWQKAKDILCEIKHEVEVDADTFVEIDTKSELLISDVKTFDIAAAGGQDQVTNESSKDLDNVIVSFDSDNIMADVMDNVSDTEYDHKDDVKPRKRRKNVGNKARKCAKKLSLKTCDNSRLEDESRGHFEDCHNPFYCSPCCKSFISKDKLEAHVRKHVPEACDKCGDMLASNAAYRRHQRISSCADRRKCPICQQRFHPATLKKHLGSHSDASKLFCPRDGCNKSFVHSTLLDEHISKVHDKVRNFECDICKEKFFTEDKMSFHKKKHEDLMLFCERCGKSGEGVPRQVMQTHINRCAYQFECKMCGVKFPSKEKHDKHVSNHTEHTCDKCNKVLPTIKKYRQHLAWSSCAERVMCKYCGQYFSPTTIKKHEGKHKSNQNIQCPREGCEECFHNEIRLKRHLEKHDGIRNFTCDVCSKGFFNSKDLKRHKDIVHNKMEGKHVCGICGKKYHAPCKLEVHIKSHTGEKGFPCNLCEKAFTTKPRLKRHIAINHDGIKPEVKIWPCQLCSKEFTKQYNLTRHYKSVHKVDQEEIYGSLNPKPVKMEEA